MRQYSAQQQAVFAVVTDETGGNILLEAVAGSGKTTTLVGIAERINARLRVAYCAFNNKISKEVEGKTAHLSHVTSKTFHSFGFAALRKVAPRVKMEGSGFKEKKLYTLAIGLGMPDLFLEFTRKAVSMAKQHAFGIEHSPVQRPDWYALADHYEMWDALAKEGEDLTATTMDEAVTWAERLLERSNATLRELIDFDDMIYGPLVLNARVDQYDWVLVDEAQDTNPARRLLAKKMLRPGGRLVAVGDPHQAIYGFAGADADALDLIAAEFGCTRMPLSVSYRCPTAVVERARQWVSHIDPSPTAEAGVVRDITEEEFTAREHATLKVGDVVLCRNTKPLVELAYQLIRQGIGAKVEGKDIGTGLVALTRRWKVASVSTLANKLDDYLGKQIQRLLAKGKELQAQNLEDKVQTLQVIIGTMPGTAKVAELQAKIQALFGDTDGDKNKATTVVLSTIHKSKGREWRRVFLLGRNRYMPSKYARQDWQRAQEINLMYVAATRSQHELVEVSVALSDK